MHHENRKFILKIVEKMAISFIDIQQGKNITQQSAFQQKGAY